MLLSRTNSKSVFKTRVCGIRQIRHSTHPLSRCSSKRYGSTESQRSEFSKCSQTLQHGIAYVMGYRVNRDTLSRGLETAVKVFLYFWTIITWQAESRLDVFYYHINAYLTSRVTIRCELSSQERLALELADEPFQPIAVKPECARASGVTSITSIATREYDWIWLVLPGLNG